VKILRSRAFQAAVSLLVGAVFLWLAIARIDMAQLWTNLRQVDLAWLALAFAAYWLALTLRSWRWRIILAPVRRLPFGQVFYGLLVGYAANYVLPARLGELVRADFLGRRYGISRLSVVGTIVVERLFDVIVFVGFIFAGLGALHQTNDSRIGPILHTVEVVAVGCVILAIVLGALLYARHKTLPGPLAFLQEQLKALAEGLHLITGAQEVAILSLATAIVWTADSIAVLLLCRSLGIELGFLPLLLVMGMSCLAALIPAAPANIGALQYALVLAFELLGLPGGSGFSLALLTQGCLVASCILVGGAFYVRATLVPVLPAPSNGPAK
jgi:glycosyltransferase 2 family protein